MAVPDPELITKTITENGTYSASSDNAYGYSSLIVNVSNTSNTGTIIQDQDGYVVLEDDGLGYGVIPLTITEDGVYNAPSHFAYNPVTVDILPDVVVEVPVGGAKFIDYDGTVLHTYTIEEFAELSALPANPSHTGLVA
ncbi:MAG: hypothetical protein LIR50_06845 [Bacillota bacterium]|nr:hypothetical protein [Bacillota bacterium]